MQISSSNQSSINLDFAKKVNDYSARALDSFAHFGSQRDRVRFSDVKKINKALEHSEIIFSTFEEARSSNFAKSLGRLSSATILTLKKLFGVYGGVKELAVVFKKEHQEGSKLYLETLKKSVGTTFEILGSAAVASSAAGLASTAIPLIAGTATGGLVVIATGIGAFYLSNKLIKTLRSNLGF